MNTKSTLLGSLSAFVWLYFMGWGFYNFLAVDFFVAHTVNMPQGVTMDLGMITLGSFIQAIVVALMVHRARDFKFFEGFKTGALVGLFIGAGVGALQYGSVQLVDLTAVLVDAVWSVFYYGMAGGIVAWVFAKKQEA